MWYHNKQPVKESKDIVIYQDVEGVCKLTINEVFPEDEGEYTCEAMNAIGEAICATSLVVEGNPIINFIRTVLLSNILKIANKYW